MLSYRHSFHAGNFADVHKHLVLTVLLDYLTRKETPLCYIDTHSGAGCYDLEDKPAMKNQEYKNGVFRLLANRKHAPDIAQTYFQIIDQLNSSGNTKYYPGSPHIAANLLRGADRLVLTELHSSDYPLLKQHFKEDKRVAVHHQNGYQSLKAFIPPKEKRGLILIDPAYELADEFKRVSKEVIQAYRKWPTGCYAVWYPILLRSTIDNFEQSIIASGIKKILVSEICIHRDDVPRRLNGSGMLIINPPWRSEETLHDLQPWLLNQLRQEDNGFERVEWISEP
jgi:23S rRNA (adenine2030-N6)-methyltransferase